MRRHDTAADWSRLLWLDREIRAGSYPSREALMEEFGCSRRTASSTVAFLRGSLRAPVQHDRRRKGYVYTDTTYALPTVFLQEGKLLGLLLAEQVSRQYLGTPLEAPLREAVRKLSRYLPEEVALEAGELAGVFHFAGGGGLDVPLLRFADLERAARERRVVHLSYHGAHRGERTERDVEPHFLHNVRGDWSLVAWDALRGEPREFMLTRIEEHRVLERRFTRRPELAKDVYVAPMFRTERGREPYEVELRFDAYQARWIRECTLHPSQQVEEHLDGGLTLRLQVGGEGDVLRWVLGYGSHVEVVSPSSLRARVEEELRAALGQYGSSASRSDAEWRNGDAPDGFHRERGS